MSYVCIGPLINSQRFNNSRMRKLIDSITPNIFQRTAHTSSTFSPLYPLSIRLVRPNWRPCSETYVPPKPQPRKSTAIQSSPRSHSGARKCRYIRARIHIRIGVYHRAHTGALPCTRVRISKSWDRGEPREAIEASLPSGRPRQHRPNKALFALGISLSFSLSPVRRAFFRFPACACTLRVCVCVSVGMCVCDKEREKLSVV